jgi:Tol biopolymer transport system component
MVGTDDGVPIQITDESSLNVSPEWLPDSRHLLFVSDRDGARGIYVVEVGPEGPIGEPRSLLSASDPHSISVSGDGRKLAYAKFTLRENLRAVSIPERGIASLRDARRVTTGNQVVSWPEVSADGRWLAFSSNRRGDNLDIHSIPEGGGTYAVLVDEANDVVQPSWSPDGIEVVFIHRASEEGRYELNLVPAGGGEPVVLAAFSGDTQAPKWSRDGLSVAFQTFGDEGADHTTIWTVSRPAIGEAWGDPVEFPDYNCYWPEWSPTDDVIMCWLYPDSRFLLLDRTGQALDTLDAREVRRTASGPLDAVFSRDGSLIYFMGREEDGSEGVWSLPVTGGEATKVVVFDDPSVNVGGRFTVGPDAIYLTVSEYESDIWVVDLVF